jgi:hypothetical protein
MSTSAANWPNMPAQWRKTRRAMHMAGVWGERAVRLGVETGEPYQAYWRARLAARAAFRARPDLKGGR